MTDDSAFKKQVRTRMAETGEKYTVARREVIAGQDPDQPSVVLRVYLNQQVDLDLELDGEAAREYAAADERGRREIAGRLLTDQLVTDQELRAEAEDAAIRGVVQRGVDRAVGVSAVEVSRTPDRVRVRIRAARPIMLAGPRGTEADRLRGELEELTGKRVRLDLLAAPGPQEVPEQPDPDRLRARPYRRRAIGSGQPDFRAQR